MVPEFSESSESYLKILNFTASSETKTEICNRYLVTQIYSICKVWSQQQLYFKPMYFHRNIPKSVG